VSTIPGDPELQQRLSITMIAPSAGRTKMRGWEKSAPRDASCWLP